MPTPDSTVSEDVLTFAAPHVDLTRRTAAHPAARAANATYSLSSGRSPAIAVNQSMPVATAGLTSAKLNKPAKIPKKLVAAISKDGAKKYKIRLSVTPINEPTSEEGASGSAPTP